MLTRRTQQGRSLSHPIVTKMRSFMGKYGGRSTGSARSTRQASEKRQGARSREMAYRRCSRVLLVGGLKSRPVRGLLLSEPSYGRMMDGKILGDVPGALPPGQAGTHQALLVSCKLRLAAHALAGFNG